jgi:hypothetical protein
LSSFTGLIKIMDELCTFLYSMGLTKPNGTGADVTDVTGREESTSTGLI